MIRIERKRKKKQIHINVLPLVDIIFQLLLFFLLTSTFLSQKAMTIQLPASATASTQARGKIILSLKREGTLFLNGEAISFEQLRKKLRTILKREREKKVSLQADRHLPLQEVITVLDLLREAGVENFELLTIRKD